MAKIENVLLYPYKAVPANDDYITGTDSENSNATVSFKVSAFKTVVAGTNLPDTLSKGATTGGHNIDIVGTDRIQTSTHTAQVFNFTTAATTHTVGVISGASLTTGKLLQLISDSASVGTRTLLELTNDNALATGTTLLQIRNDSTGLALDVTGNTSLTGNIAISGNISTGTWNGTAIGTIYGGTGLATYTAGDILYSSATNVLSALAKGTNGQIMTLAGGIPSWATSTKLDGPVSSTDNALMRFDSTTGKISQNSIGILSDTGVLSGITAYNAPDGTVTNPIYAFTSETNTGIYLSGINIMSIGVNGTRELDIGSGLTVLSAFAAEAGIKLKSSRHVTTKLIDTTAYAWLGNTDSGIFTFTLPAGVQDTTYRVINTGSSANLLTLAPDGTEHLQGANSSITLADGVSVTITYDATDGWY